MRRNPTLVAMDLEGVLVPEIWINVAERTGIVALRRTTRDEPDYDKLMRFRLGILAEHGIGIATIRAAIAGMGVLPGACELVTWIRARAPLIIMSDTYYEFAGPLMEALGQPTLFCNSLEIDPEGRITGYRLRLPSQKRANVEALNTLNFRVIAVGDSFNDIAMLQAAEQGLLYRPSQAVLQAHPDFTVVHDYTGVRERIEAFLAG